MSLPTSTTSTPTAGGNERRSLDRLVALDLARFVAITGMIAAHVAPIEDPVLFMLVLGPSSTLFAILGGMSAVFTAQSLTRRFGARGMAAGFVARGLVLAVLGFALGFIPNVVNVVLVPFGAMLMVLPLFLRLSSRTLMVIAVLLAMLGPVLLTAAGPFLDPQGMGGLSLTSLPTFLQGLFLTGEYPLRTWIVYGLIGIVLARAVLWARQHGSSRVLGGRLTAIGLLFAIVAWVGGALWAAIPTRPAISDAILTSFSHTGTTGDIVRTSGIAVVVIGVLLVLIPATAQIPLPLPAEVLRFAGAAPLTIYSIHVSGFAIATSISYTSLIDGQLASPWWLTGSGAFLLHLAIAVLIGAMLHVLHRRGPLEAVLTRVSDASAGSIGTPDMGTPNPHRP